MNFFSVFRSQIPGIIDRLKIVRVELDQVRDNLKQLMILEGKLISKEVEVTKYQNLLQSAVNNFAVAVWIKDINGKFIYVNKACCENILKCTEEEALGLKNGELKKNALSEICVASDKEVLKQKCTLRFIEHAYYDNGKHVFLDTIKSLVYDDNNKIVGIVGNAIDLSNKVPDTVKAQRNKSSFIEIPLNTIMSSRQIISFIERRLKPRK